MSEPMRILGIAGEHFDPQRSLTDEAAKKLIRHLVSWTRQMKPDA